MTPQRSVSADGRSRNRWLAFAAFAAVAIAACEDPAAPVSCGSIPAVTINVGESSTVPACFTDANGDMVTVSASSSNPSVATAIASGNTVTVTAVSPGNASVTITASDPGGLSGTAAFQVTVPNRAPRPVGDIASVTVVAGETKTVNVSGNFMEPDGQALSYSASSSDTDVATASASGSNITVTAVGRGKATVTVTATDPGGASATQSFQVTVPNRAPEPRGSMPEQEVRAGETTNVDPGPYFTDPDGDALTYTASSSTPAVATVSVVGRMLRIAGVGSGRTTVTVTAADPAGETATQNFRVTVPNRAPEAVGTIPAQSLTEGRTRTVVLRPYFSDPDGDALTYRATSANAAIAVGTVSGNVLTIRAVGAGFTVITVTARDPGGETATQIVTVEVSAANRAPQAQGTIPAQTVNAGGGTTLNVSSYFTDPDGDALTYSAVSANPAVATVTAAGATLTITGRSRGNTTVTVTARDPGGLTATQSASVTVSEATAPDLLFSDVRPTEITVAPGDSEVLAFTIRNAGNANSATTAARGYQSTDATITTGDRVASNDVSVQGLVPGGTFRITFTVRIASSAPAGTFYLGMCVDPVTGESNANNNCSSAVKVTVALPRPDLAATRVSPSRVTVTPNTGEDVTFTVENLGSAGAQSTRAYFYESEDNTISTSDTQVGSSTRIPALAAGNRHSVRPTITSDRPPGSQYWYGMCIARARGAGNAADESNTDNNCSPPVQVGVVWEGGPDLVVAGADPVALSVRVGQSREIAFTIQNIGDGPTTAPTVAALFRSTDDDTGSFDDVALDGFTVPLLGSLATYKYTYPLTGAGNVGDVYYLGICMDNTGANGEGAIQRTNNCSTTDDGTVMTVVIVSASAQQSDARQPGEDRTGRPVSRATPARVARPEPVESGLLPPGSFTMVVESVEVRSPGTR